MFPIFCFINCSIHLTSSALPVLKYLFKRLQSVPDNSGWNASKLHVHSSSILSDNSCSVCFYVKYVAATILPELHPEIIFGSNFSSYKVFTTPMWYIPRSPPPLNIRAVLPKTCLISLKNWILFIKGRLDSYTILKQRLYSTKNSSISVLVPI